MFAFAQRFEMRSMQKQTSSKPQSLPPIAQWLRNARANYKVQTGKKLSQAALGDLAEIDTTYVGKIELGQKLPSKQVIVSLARALAPPEKDKEAYQNLLNEGLHARGFLPEDEFTRELSPEVMRLVEVYNGAEEEGRRLMEAAADMVARAQSRSSIGRNADDFDSRESDTTKTE